MTVENLYGYLDAIYHKKMVDGPIVEIGVAYGGTTALACQFLSKIGCHKKYYCVDTFSGFVESQLDKDHKLGLSKIHDNFFSDSSLKHVKENLNRWGITRNIDFIQHDICKANPSDLPDNISICLLDVDLRDPIYDALHLLKNKMAEGGIILVDDCKDGTSWVGADIGYREFVQEEQLEPKYYMGFGVVEFAKDSDQNIPWVFSLRPNKIPKNYYTD